MPFSKKFWGLSLFSFELAQNFRENENEDLPLNSTIGKKSSDIFGNMKLKPNQYLDFDYNFAVEISQNTWDFKLFSYLEEFLGQCLLHVYDDTKSLQNLC